MTKTNLQVIGLTGANASGKGSIAKVLIKLGYTFSSLSDILRDEITQKGLEISRDTLITMGKNLRANSGPGILAQKMLPKLKGPLHVVDSFRHPDEVQFFREHTHFSLFASTAPAELRFTRAQRRGRNENAQTLEEFINKEKQESINPKAQQLEQTILLADQVISNSGEREDLENAVLTALKEIKFPPFQA